ncbi:hypothetical protein C3L33_15514, partial [Rhododendron williamsianum]
MDVLKWRLLPLLPLLASLLFYYIKNPLKPSQSECSLLAHSHFWISSKRIVTPNGVISGAVEVKGGNIILILEEDWQGNVKTGQVIDYGDAVVMPGLIDVHVHLDDPGREEWEGFPSGTRAAAAGLISLEYSALKLFEIERICIAKIPTASDRGLTTLVDMPLNSFPSTVSEETFELKIKAAEKRIHVDVGFWGGLVPENAFNRSALEGLLKAGVLGLKAREGLSVLAKYKRPLLVHAEVQHELEGIMELDDSAVDPRSYSTYLKTRPASWEEAAIRELLTVTNGTRTGGPAEGAHLHIVHLSDARSSLELIKFVLPVTWTYGRKYGITLEQLASWWSEKPAKLAGLDLKGAIAIGNHADIVVWEPEVEFVLNDTHPVYIKHPVSVQMAHKHCWCLGSNARDYPNLCDRSVDQSRHFQAIDEGFWFLLLIGCIVQWKMYVVKCFPAKTEAEKNRGNNVGNLATKNSMAS